MEEEESAVKAKKNQATAKSNFAALSLEDDAESEDEVSLPAEVKPKGKGKKRQTSAFAALELEEDDPELDAGRMNSFMWPLYEGQGARHAEALRAIKL